MSVSAYRSPIPPVGGSCSTPPWAGRSTGPQDRVGSPNPPPRPATVVVVRRSVFLAALLPTLFGPLGLLYATPVGAGVAVVLLLACLTTAGFFFSLLVWMMFWPVFTLWSVFAAMRHNARTHALAWRSRPW